MTYAEAANHAGLIQQRAVARAAVRRLFHRQIPNVARDLILTNGGEPCSLPLRKDVHLAVGDVNVIEPLFSPKESSS
jgi:hypothetical protein